MPFGNRPPLPGPRCFFGSGDDFAGFSEIVTGNRPVPVPWCLFGSGDDFAGLPEILIGNRPVPVPWCLFGSGDDFAGLPELVTGNRPLPGPLFLLWFTEGLGLCSKGNRPPLPAKCDVEVSLLEPVKKKKKKLIHNSLMLLSDSRKGELPENPVSLVQPNLMASLV